jgi:hypothetical protein
MLLTRKQVIDIWLKQSDEHLNSYGCPNCRDLLFKEGNYFRCKNMDCKNFMGLIDIHGNIITEDLKTSTAEANPDNIRIDTKDFVGNVTHECPYCNSLTLDSGEFLLKDSEERTCVCCNKNYVSEWDVT